MRNRKTNIVLNILNFVINSFVILILFGIGLYAAYALWDNQQIYSAADDVRADMLQLKPKAEEDGGASFEDLLEINPDVRAWITLDGTNIDYPVLQGENNLTYINTDVYGKFALAGSIFLDSRNQDDFSDCYNLLYGHHMDNGGMFGDLDKYKDADFFDGHITGTLLLPDRSYALEVFACCVTSASDENIFNPDRWQEGIDGLMLYAQDEALHYREISMDNNASAEGLQVLALSTCDTDFTDARTVVLAAMVPEGQEVR